MRRWRWWWRRWRRRARDLLSKVLSSVSCHAHLLVGQNHQRQERTGGQQLVKVLPGQWEELLAGRVHHKHQHERLGQVALPVGPQLLFTSD